MAQNLTPSGVVFATTSGILQTDSTFLFNSTSNTLYVPNISITGMSPGSVLFVGSSGQVSQNNAHLYWDYNNNRLGVGITATPAAKFHVDTDPGENATAVYISNDDTLDNTRTLHMLTRSSGIDLTLENYAYDQSGVKVAYIFGSPTGTVFTPNGLYNADYQTFNASSGLITVARHRIGSVNYGGGSYGGFQEFYATSGSNTNLVRNLVMSGGANYSVSMNPLAHLSYDLGTVNLNWRNIYAQSGIFTAGVSSPAFVDKQIAFASGNQLIGESNLVWDYTNNRLGINQSSPVATLQLATSSSATVGVYVIGSASQAADYVLVQDSSANELFSVGAVDAVFNGNSLARGFAVISANHGPAFYIGGTYGTVNINRQSDAPGTILTTLADFPATTSGGTNYYRNINNFMFYSDISSGVTDGGYRVGCWDDYYIIGTGFCGTLEALYGHVLTAGTFGSDPSGHINNVYGLYVGTSKGANCTATNEWSIFSYAGNHYFAGDVRVGTTSNAGSFLANFAGHVGPQTDVTYDLGAVSYCWRNVYAQSGIFTAGVSSPAFVDKQVAFASGNRLIGESGFVWDYTNNYLGINQGSPQAAIDINDGDILINRPNSTTRGITMQSSGGGVGSTAFWQLHSDKVIFGVGGSSVPIHFRTAGGIENALYLSTAGLVGVGHSAPVSQLHTFQNTTSTSTGNGITIENSGTGDSMLQFLLTGGQRYVAGIDNSDSDKFKLTPGANLQTSPAITANTSSQVGIGYDSPGFQLSLGTNLAWTKLALYDDAAVPFGIGLQGAELLFHLGNNSSHFRFYNTPSGTSRFAIAGTGFVGINVASPLTTLHITPTAAARTGVYVIGVAAQSADLLRIDDSSANEWFSVGATDVVINESSLDRDFRIETDGNANMFAVDGGLNSVGIGYSTPWNDKAVLMEVDGSVLTKNVYRTRPSQNLVGLWRDGATQSVVPWGRLMNKNTDFIMSPTGYYGTTFPTGYNLYNNSGARPEFTASVINYSGVPNSTNKVMMLNYSGGAGGTIPGFGGFIANDGAGNVISLGPSGTAVTQFGKYFPGNRFLQVIWAKVPAGRDLALASNAIGVSGTSVWLTPTSGTDKWEKYVAMRVIDESGTMGTTSHVYVAGGADTSFAWYVASCELIAIDEGMSAQNHGLINVGHKENINLLWGNLLSTTNTFLAVDTGNVTVGTSGNPGTFRINSRGNVGPNDDNLWDLGSSSYRWKAIYAATGVIPNLTSVSGINGIDIAAYLTGSGFSVSGIAGTLSETYIAFGAPTSNTVTGEALFTWNTTNKQMVVGGNTATNSVVTISGNNAEKLSLVVPAHNATGSYIRFAESHTTYSGAYIHYDSLNKRLELGTHVAATTGLSDDTASINILSSNKYVGIRHHSPVSPLHVWENTSNTDTFAGITMEQSGAGDAIIQFLLTGAQRWVVGIDNSDDDKFKIGRSTDLSNTPLLTFTTDSRIGLINASTPTAYFHLIPTGNVIDILKFDNSSGNELFSISPTDVVFNEDGGDRDFRIEGDGNANLFTLDAGLDSIGIGGIAYSIHRTSTYIHTPTVTSGSANYLFANNTDITDIRINSGVTDGGWRAGYFVSAYPYTTEFRGTLNAVFSFYASHGAFGTVASGTVSNSFGLYIESNRNGSVAVSHLWGMYLNDVDGVQKNYVGGDLRIGTTNNFGFFKLNVEGDVGPGTTQTYRLGNGSYEWLSINAVTGVFSSQVTANTGVFNELVINNIPDQRILFSSGTTVTGMPQFVYDYSNRRFGLGTGSPSATLHIYDSGATDGTQLLRIDGERSWGFYQRGTGASSMLHLTDNTGGKHFNIDTTNYLIKRNDATGSGFITFQHGSTNGRTAIGNTQTRTAFTPGATVEIYGESGVKALQINAIKNNCDVAYSSSGTTDFWYMDADTDSVGWGGGGVSANYAYVFIKTNFAPAGFIDIRDSAGLSAFDIASTATRFNSRVADMDFAIYGSGSTSRALISCDAGNHSVGVGAGSSSSYQFLIQPPALGAVPTHYFAIRDSGALDLFNVYSTGIVVNDGGFDRDLRIESTGITHMFVVDAGTNTVNIANNSTTSGLLSISGTNPEKLFITGPANDPTGYYIRFAETSTTYQGAYIHYESVNNKFEIGSHAGADNTYTGDSAAITIMSSNAIGIRHHSPASQFHIWENNSETTNGAGVTIEQSGAGDSVIQFLLTGQQRFVMGIDNSDSNKFKISPVTDLASGTFVINSNAHIGLGTASPNFQASLGSNLANTKLALYDDVANPFGIGIQTSEMLFHIGNNSSKFSFYNQSSGTSRFTILGTGLVGINQPTPTATLHIVPTAATRTGIYVVGATSQSADYMRVVDSSANELFSIGASDCIVNVAGLDRDFAVSTTTSSASLYVDAGNGTVCINLSAGTAGQIFRTLADYPDALTSGTNFYRNHDHYATSTVISPGMVDLGYRVGAWYSTYFSNSGFQGTLTSQYGMIVQGGTFDGSETPSGTISNVYGYYVSLSKGVNCTHTNEWGFYHSGRGNNYFAGQIRTGTTSNAGSFQINSAGHVGPQTTLTYDLGAQSYKWRNIYGGSGIFDNVTISGSGLSMIVSYPGDVTNTQVVFASGDNNFAGTNNFVWNHATNRVGVHTSTPSGSLHVTSQLNASPWVSPLVRFQRTGGGNWIDFSADSNSNWITTDDAGSNHKSLAFYVGCSGGDFNLAQTFGFAVSGGTTTREIMRIRGSGLIGINTTTPTGSLTILNRTENSGVITLALKAINNQNSPLFDAWNTSNQSLFQVTTSGVTVNDGGTASNFRIESDNNPTLFNVIGVSDWITIGGTGNPGSFRMSVSGDLGPESSGTRSLGSAAYPWNNIWVKNINGSVFSGGGGGGATSVDSGCIAFGDGTTLRTDSNLRWDSGNQRLGINAGATPSHTLSLKPATTTTIGLHIVGNISQAFDLFHVTDASSNELFSVGVVDTIVNEGGSDRDFRVETDGLPFMFYVDGGLNYASFGAATNPGSFLVAFAGDIGPEASGTRSLGSSAYSWENLYISNNSSIYYGNDAEIYANNGTGNIAFAGASGYLGFKIASGTATVTDRYFMNVSGFSPWHSNNYDLGTTNRVWRNLYCSSLESVTQINGIPIATYLVGSGGGAGASGVISSGTVLFGTNAGTISGETAFSWDSTNNRLGVNVGSRPFHTFALQPSTTSTIGVHISALVAQTADLFIVTDNSSNEHFSVGVSDIIVNEDGLDRDFRVEGDTDTSLIFVDAGLDEVGIGAPPSGAFKFTVNGNIGPWTSGVRDLGSSSLTFKDIYLRSTGILNIGTGSLSYTNSSSQFTSNSTIVVTGSMLVSDSTSGAPGLGFRSDTNVGFWRIGADDVGFSAAGVGRFRFDTSKISPLQTVSYDLGATNAYWRKVYVDDVICNTINGVAPGGGGSIGGSLAANQIAYGASANTIAGNNNLWWDNSSVRMGIGTNSPDTILHIDNGTSNTYLTLEKDDARDCGIRFDKAGTVLGSMILDSVDNLVIETDSANDDIKFKIHTQGYNAANVSTEVTSADRFAMIIDASGWGYSTYGVTGVNAVVVLPMTGAGSIDGASCDLVIEDINRGIVMRDVTWGNYVRIRVSAGVLLVEDVSP